MATQNEILTNLGSTRASQSNVTSRRIQFQLHVILLYAIMVLLSALFMFPFFWTVSSSLKAPFELMTFPPTWLPETPQWQNYARVIEKVPFMLWTWNSIFVVTIATLGSVISASVVAYSFARFEYPGRDVVFIITLGTMMLPAQVTLIPQFILFNQLGWINTLYPLWVPYIFGGGAFNIFLLRQFFRSLPRELDEAALIDGASYARILWTILLPLTKPALATVAVISFINHWNDFVNPLIYLNSPEKFTLALGLNYFKSVPESSGLPLQHLLMAASVMIIMPVLILFFAAQRYFVQGIVLSGIKG
ncbi:MAG TPA: carbohydrate ABC transporter permease [Caldilineaceae bacterium]|nr:carbohydrate ABC transporter permease [Caldilineaceae bacterium]